MLHIDFIQPLLQVQDLLGVQHDVGCLALEPAGRLVQHDARVGQREPHVLVSRREQQRAHRRGLPDAEGGNGRPHELHGVVDRQPRCHHPAGRVDVHRDLFLRIVGLQEQELGNHQRGHHVLDRTADEDDALLQEAREDVIGALAAVGLLDHHRNESIHIDVVRVTHVGAGPFSRSSLVNQFSRRRAAVTLQSSYACPGTLNSLMYGRRRYKSPAGVGISRGRIRRSRSGRPRHP